MEVLRHLRPEGLIARPLLALLAPRAFGAPALALALLTAGCAGTQRTAAPLRPNATGPQWPVKTREHVDLWLHGFALLMDDTATVPLFARGYRDRLTIIKNQRGVYTRLDSLHANLATSLRMRPQLEGAQFLALYFGTWEEMRQAFEYFFKAEGDPRSANNQQVQGIIAFLAGQFPRKEDREWAQRFIGALDDEHTKFHHAWWIEQQRTLGAGLAAADSLWQRKWRPVLQPMLAHTQQANGDLILSTVLGGEGRAIAAGKNAGQVAVAWPATADSAEAMLFVFAHEASGAVAAVAVNDNLTPAQQREGLGARYLAQGLVRGGALIVERIDPALAERYALWYLAQAGKPSPAGSALAALEAAFPMPAEMIASMKRQVDLAFTGI